MTLPVPGHAARPTGPARCQTPALRAWVEPVIPLTLSHNTEEREQLRSFRGSCFPPLSQLATRRADSLAPLVHSNPKQVLP